MIRHLWGENKANIAWQHKRLFRSILGVFDWRMISTPDPLFQPLFSGFMTTVAYASGRAPASAIPLQPPAAQRNPYTAIGEQNTKVLDCLRGRGAQARAADRGEHSCCTQAGSLGWASFPYAGVRYCGCHHNRRADHGEDRQQVADAELTRATRPLRAKGGFPSGWRKQKQAEKNKGC